MKLSIIIPAFNEAKQIRACLESIQRSMREAVISPYEIIVVDDDSTDDTADIARSLGARVVHSGKRNIAATRNRGAAAAESERLLFVDADTIINPCVVMDMTQAFENGFVGGGAFVHFSNPAPWWAHPFIYIWNGFTKLFRLPAGSFFFTKREPFQQAGGFNEEVYATEEIGLATKLKQYGRLKILSSSVHTSSRKLYQFSFGEILLLLTRMIFSPSRTLRDRSRLSLWYERRD